MALEWESIVENVNGEKSWPRRSSHSRGEMAEWQIVVRESRNEGQRPEMQEALGARHFDC